ncbi:MAG: HAMP domain-containing protein [Deltaproteobacteria bacterium]|nr:HAMP domain-containing protein [Deltaproteobacteria bacterium]
MRSLYTRIFLSFWLAMLLTGATLVVLALTTEDPGSELRLREQSLRRLGHDLVWVYESRGAGTLASETARLEEGKQMQALLFKGGEGPLGGPPAPAGIPLLVAESLATHAVQRRFGPDRLWLAVPLTDEYVLVAGLPIPSRLEWLLSPRRLAVRLMVTFVFASAVCFVLARSLTAPIRKLRAATGRFAAGDFSARVGPELGRRRDEIAQLGGDFDVMAERIEELLRAQRRLVRDISHELRSPLARLTVALELARQDSNPEVAAPLNRIELEATRLNDLIGQLLALAALESDAETLVREPVVLRTLVAEIADDAAFEARHRNRTIDVHPGGETATVPGSAPMLRQAVENVVRNALRHTDEGTSVEITVGERQGEGIGTAVVSVRDHGPGVSEEALPHLFEPFYRAAEARDRRTGGSGIGLAITDRAVRLHGGSVAASNAPGGGLLVEISLPAGEPVPTGGGAPAISEAPGAS